MRNCKNFKTVIYLGVSAIVLIIGVLSGCKKEVNSNVPLVNVTIKCDTLLVKGYSYKLMSTFSPANATNSKLTWTSSDESVVAISETNYTAVGIGKATITLTSTDGTNINSKVEVRVIDYPKISIVSVSDITYTSARFQIRYDKGGDSNFKFGICYDTIPRVATAHGKITYCTDADTSLTIEDFNPGQTYYVRCIATNTLGSTYSDSIVVKTPAITAEMLESYMLNNVLAYGYIAKYQNWIYYCNFQDKQRLYRIKIDGSSKQLLDKTSDCVMGINIIPPYIYYAANLNFRKVQRAFLDGTNVENYLGNGTDYYVYTIGPIQVYNNFIYTNGYSMYFRISTDGLTLQNSSIYNFSTNIYNNKVYFCSEKINGNDSLYTINSSNLDGSNITELYRGYNLYYTDDNSLGVYQDMVFFKEKYTVKKFDLAYPQLVSILPIKAKLYNIVNNTIFYINQEDGDKLYRCDLNGNLVTKICDDAIKSISVIDDKLYYYNSTDKHLYRINQDGSGKELVD